MERVEKKIRSKDLTWEEGILYMHEALGVILIPRRNDKNTPLHIQIIG